MVKNRTVQALSVVALSLLVAMSFAQAESPKNIQDRGKAMLRDAEDMVMHGGMGDGKAIVHHCGEVAKHAEAILKRCRSPMNMARTPCLICRKPSSSVSGWLRWAIRSIPEPV